MTIKDFDFEGKIPFKDSVFGNDLEPSIIGVLAEVEISDKFEAKLWLL